MAKPFSCTFFFFTTLIFLPTSPIAGQSSGNFTVGQSISATIKGTPLLSPSGDFAFGFHQFPGNNTLFLLAIWYARISDTIIWYAHAGNPVPEGSTVTLTTQSGLILTDPQGASLWNTSSELNDGDFVNYGLMTDSGNFILKNGSSSYPVWQSFNHPTDTLLPGQFMDINGVVNSRLSETQFTKGRFQLRLIPGGDLVLNTRDLASGNPYGAYYVLYGTKDEINPGQRLIYNESGYMYILTKNGSTYHLQQNKTLPEKEYYQRATLNFDGVLLWYSIPKASLSSGWSMVQALPNNICTSIGASGPQLGSGICGFNSICILGNDRRPTCKCPPGYSLLDSNDTYGNRIPNFRTEGCKGYAEHSIKSKYRLEILPNTNWPFSDYESLEPYDEDGCKKSCLNDCFCAAVIFQETSTPTCWKKKAPLSYGKQDSIVHETTWIKVGNVNFSGDPISSLYSFPPKTKSKTKSLVKIILSCSLFVNLILLGAIGWRICFICHWKKPLKVTGEDQRKKKREYSNIHFFSYKELSEATNGFQEELGRGAFGIVYKGMIASVGPPKWIAVKKLDRVSESAEKEFKTEVNGLGQIHHKNLVRLVGICEEGEQRLLVYEYVSNGTLANFLFSDLRPSWVSRTQIIFGIAGGLLYLHEECSTQIIHCDIKPQNILLDENYNALIADFGLAKLLVLNQTHTNTVIRGTKGYVAPEWFRNNPVTAKVDVYSFGVLMLEIICCRKNVSMELEEEGTVLTDWAFDCYQSNSLDIMVNEDMEALDDWQRLKRFLMVALLCIQEDPNLRPTMRSVMHMLEGLAEVPKPPSPTMSSI